MLRHLPRPRGVRLDLGLATRFTPGVRLNDSREEPRRWGFRLYCPPKLAQQTRSYIFYTHYPLCATPRPRATCSYCSLSVALTSHATNNPRRSATNGDTPWQRALPPADPVTPAGKNFLCARNIFSKLSTLSSGGGFGSQTTRDERRDPLAAGPTGRPRRS